MAKVKAHHARTAKTETPSSDPSAKASPQATPPLTDGHVALSDKRSAMLSTFKGKTRLDVRWVTILECESSAHTVSPQ